MTSENNSEDLVVNNLRSMRRLERAIAMSQGQFSLILVCCNYQSLCQQVVNHLQEHACVPIQKLTLHPSITTLFTTILSAIEEPPPSAMIVLGLESVAAIEQVLSATNLVRDEFRKHFPFPLVLCINDEILQKLIRLAPDFRVGQETRFGWKSLICDFAHEKQLPRDSSEAFLQGGDDCLHYE